MHEELAKQFSLRGRVAVITGAASGIGQEAARVLALAGAAVIAADIAEGGLAETARQVTGVGGIIATRRTDVASQQEMRDLADQALATHGRLDIWVNAAGTLVFCPIVEATPEDVRRIMSVNLDGVYWGCAAAGRAMEPQHAGSIINISSAGADAPAPGLSLYSATKAAVNMLTRTAAVEFGPYSIRVNAVAPGFVETAMTTYRYRDASGQIDAAKREEILRDRARGSPLGITGTPFDIAMAILYLASDASRYVTGQVLRPNGGVAMP